MYRIIVAHGEHVEDRREPLEMASCVIVLSRRCQLPSAVCDAWIRPGSAAWVGSWDFSLMDVRRNGFADGEEE